MSFKLAVLGAAFASVILAKTDLSGCTSTVVSSPAGASYAWYVPGTGELCDMLDCGGGRAPPKTDVPGCPLYTGTASYSPSYLPGYGASAAQTYSSMAASMTSASWTSWDSSAAASMASPSWSAWETDTALSSWDLYTTSATGSQWPSSWSSSWSGSSYAATTGTNEPLICAIASSCPPGSTSTYTYSTSTSIVTQTSSAAGVVAGAGSNGTTTAAGTGGATGAASNGTVGSATVSSTSSLASNAAETARAWAGSAGLMLGLGAVVAVL